MSGPAWPRAQCSHLEEAPLHGSPLLPLTAECSLSGEVIRPNSLRHTVKDEYEELSPRFENKPFSKTAPALSLRERSHRRPWKRRLGPFAAQAHAGPVPLLSDVVPEGSSPIPGSYFLLPHRPVATDANKCLSSAICSAALLLICIFHTIKCSLYLGHRVGTSVCYENSVCPTRTSQVLCRA